MIIWEQTSEGYMEVLVNDCYGVVGLAGPRSGWTARIAGPCGRQTAAVLFHTAPEAREWVERQITRCCSAPELQPLPSYRKSSAAAAPASLARHVQALIAKVTGVARSALLAYQRANATHLDPRTYGQMPLCYASISATTRA